MKKDTEVCWSCSKHSLEPWDDVGHGWLKCSNCGTTHQPNPTKLGQEQVIIENISKGERDTKYRPRKKTLSRA